MSDIILNKILMPPSDIAPGEAALSVNHSTGEPQVTDGDTGLTKPFTGSFGGNFHLGEREDEQTTSSTSWQTYLTKNINGINRNNLFRAAINIFWGYSSASRDFQARILINGVQAGEIFRCEPKDGGSDQRKTDGVPLYLSSSKFPDLQTDNIFEIQFRASDSGDTARMYRALLEFWRVQ